MCSLRAIFPQTLLFIILTEHSMYTFAVKKENKGEKSFGNTCICENVYVYIHIYTYKQMCARCLKDMWKFSLPLRKRQQAHYQQQQPQQQQQQLNKLALHKHSCVVL